MTMTPEVQAKRDHMRRVVRTYVPKSLAKTHPLEYMRALRQPDLESAYRVLARLPRDVRNRHRISKPWRRVASHQERKPETTSHYTLSAVNFDLPAGPDRPVPTCAVPQFSDGAFVPANNYPKNPNPKGRRRPKSYIGEYNADKGRHEYGENRQPHNI